VPTPPLRHPARRPPHLAAVNAARNDRQPPELQAHVAQSTRQQLAGPEAVRERRALLLSSSDTQRLVPPGRDVSCCSAGPGARSTALPITCTDTTVVRFDDAQRHDARRP